MMQILYLTPQKSIDSQNFTFSANIYKWKITLIFLYNRHRMATNCPAAKTKDVHWHRITFLDGTQNWEASKRRRWMHKQINQWHWYSHWVSRKHGLFDQSLLHTVLVWVCMCIANTNTVLVQRGFCWNTIVTWFAQKNNGSSFVYAWYRVK